MRILLIADGRSPITKNWVRMLGEDKNHLFLISTYPADPLPGIEEQFTLPIGFSQFAGSQVRHTEHAKQTLKSKAVAQLRPILMVARAFITPLLLPRNQNAFLKIVDRVKPDIVHALRIPFEGMLATILPEKTRLVLSIWGNDLSLHAHTSFLMASRTRRALRRTDGLMADAASDIQLASKWGARENIPHIVVPGSGGLDLDRLPNASDQSVLIKYEIPTNCPLVINPRGFRPGSVHQDAFFKSIPLILRKAPNAYFIFTGMHDQPQADKWVRDLGINKNVSLLPFLPQHELWALYTQAKIYVSLSSHDGTPNSFLEAIACGCFPIVGDIPSLQEWLDQGKNGYLVDPHNPQAAANAVVNALKEKNLRDRASTINQKMVNSRINVNLVRKIVCNFYKQVFEN
jgi:glycosyltransferase involved in cell wall biosynthesis